GPMRAQAYGSWKTCVQEHVVRACTVRFAFREHGQDAGRRALDDERGRGFAHVAALAERLGADEGGRQRDPTFASFFPELARVFDEALAAAPATSRMPAPRIIATIPRKGDVAVDAAVTEVVVHFDQDMDTSGFAFVQRDEATFPKDAGKPRFTSA